MGTLNPKAAQNSSLKRITGITAIYAAGSVDVCRDGAKVALHIYTTEGEVLVRMSERNFIFSFRGIVDANGNPFRSLEQIDTAKRREDEAASLSAPAPVEPSRASRHAKVTGDRLRLFEEVFAIAESPHERGAIKAACRARSISYSSLMSWRNNQKKRAAA